MLLSCVAACASGMATSERSRNAAQAAGLAGLQAAGVGG